MSYRNNLSNQNIIVCIVDNAVGTRPDPIASPAPKLFAAGYTRIYCQFEMASLNLR